MTASKTEDGDERDNTVRRVRSESAPQEAHAARGWLTGRPMKSDKELHDNDNDLLGGP